MDTTQWNLIKNESDTSPAEESRSINEKMAQSKGKELFRPIQDFFVREKSPVQIQRPTPAQVEAWKQEYKQWASLEGNKVEYNVWTPEGEEGLKLIESRWF